MLPAMNFPRYSIKIDLASSSVIPEQFGGKIANMFADQSANLHVAFPSARRAHYRISL